MLQFLRDEGDSGGGNPGAETSSEAEGQEQGTGSAASPDGGSGEADAGQKPDAESDSSAEIAELKKALDRSQSEVGEYRKQARLRDEKSKETAANQDPDGSQDPPDMTNVNEVRQLMRAEAKAAMGPLAPAVQSLIEAEMVKRHPTWETDHDARLLLAGQVETNSISTDELLQFAHYGRSLPGILEDHKKEVRAEVEAEFAAKLKGQEPTGGGGSPTTPKKPSDTVSAEAGVLALADAR